MGYTVELFYLTNSLVLSSSLQHFFLKNQFILLSHRPQCLIYFLFHKEGAPRNSHQFSPCFYRIFLIQQMGNYYIGSDILSVHRVNTRRKKPPFQVDMTKILIPQYLYILDMNETMFLLYFQDGNKRYIMIIQLSNTCKSLQLTCFLDHKVVKDFTVCL